jgi:hypothetical protein
VPNHHDLKAIAEVEVELQANLKSPFGAQWTSSRSYRIYLEKKILLQYYDWKFSGFDAVQ